MKKLLLALVLVLIMANLAATPVALVVSSVNTPSVTAIVKAMCLVESDNRAHLRGRSGERGVMQFMRAEWNFTCRKLLKVDWSFDEAYDRAKSIRAGEAYMAYLINKYGDWQHAVRAYHSGHRGARLGRGTHYINAVLKTLKTGSTSWRKAKKKRNA